MLRLFVLTFFVFLGSQSWASSAINFGDMSVYSMIKIINAEHAEQLPKEYKNIKVQDVHFDSGRFGFFYQGVPHMFRFVGKGHRFVFFNGRYFSRRDLITPNEARRKVEAKFGFMNLKHKLKVFPQLRGRRGASEVTDVQESPFLGEEIDETAVRQRLDDSEPVIKAAKFEGQEDQTILDNFISKQDLLFRENPAMAQQYQLAMDQAREGFGASANIGMQAMVSIMAAEQAMDNQFGKVFFLGEDPSNIPMPKGAFSATKIVTEKLKNT